MHSLETRIPPDLVMVLCGVAALGATRLIPVLSFDWSLRIPVAAAIGCAGLALIIVAKITFRRFGTTDDPLRPALARHLVTSGVYAYTRNPMYLGHAMIVLGWSLYLANVAALSAAPVFMFYISRYQIRPEERQLSARFPEAYAAFCRRVPCWL